MRKVAMSSFFLVVVSVAQASAIPLNYQGFVYTAGTFTSFDVRVRKTPSSEASTTPDRWSVVALGQATRRPHAWFRDATGSFTTIDVPGRRTFVEGINDAGQIVGYTLEIPTPEPGSMLLFGSGLLGTWAVAFRKRRSRAKSA
jgi:hypothetical protein